ncbi:hypothetical protein FRC07_012218 [Ceratobasidium sp. 392]|nr:hypothetical protein FRC07_012218 [Ceratobasidium sp. 392]
MDAKTSGYTSDDELGALIWLAEHARDPTIGDCAYQALAGLRITHIPAPQPELLSVDTGVNTHPLVLNVVNLIGAFGNERLSNKSDDLVISLSARMHQPQSEGADKLPEFNVRAIGTGIHHLLPPLALIGDEHGLLAGLAGALSGTDVEATPWVESAAGHALMTIGLLLISQWLQMKHDGLENYLEEQPLVLECMNSALKHSWPTALNASNPDNLAYWTLSQLLVVTTIAVALADRPYGGGLACMAALALYRRANMATGCYPMGVAMLANKKLVGYLI